MANLTYSGKLKENKYETWYRGQTSRFRISLFLHKMPIKLDTACFFAQPTKL